jgi:NAD(P)-dependent dehydrogenase (short-subunit alcohol dehydrogenase family)
VGSNRTHEVTELGVYTPFQKELDHLGPGEVGYLAASIKSLQDAKNAARPGITTSTIDITDSGKVFDLNVKGVFFLTRELVPLLERAAEPGDPARVLNIGSLNGLAVPRLPNYSYAASKAAVHHLTRMLAVHLGPRGIAVNALALGPFESRMMQRTLEEHRGEFERACPLGRIGVPSDVAGAAIFLASRAAAWVNGAVLPVDGGLSVV